MRITETREQLQSRLDEIRKIQSTLDELYTDFRQLEPELYAASRAKLQAQTDRIEGFKRALLNIMKAANRADKVGTEPQAQTEKRRGQCSVR